jgi:PEP-CTERM motif
MKPRFAVLTFAVLSCLLAAAFPALAQQTLYENGPINGEVEAWTINEGFDISDSFTISSGTSAVNGLSFGVWLTAGDVLQSVDVTLSSQPLQEGTIYFDGVVNLAQSGCFVNNFGYDVCTETGSFNGTPLNNGTYWLTLQNAVSTDGDPVYWDENSGIGCHSQGCPSQAVNDSLGGTLPSEAFTILGSSPTGSTPEPASLVLFGSGVIGALGILRRKTL